jgi:TRAP transporter TAXI family solute receptor
MGWHAKRRALFVGMMILLVGFPVYVHAAPKLPDLITWATYDVGTSTYMQTACMADGVTKKTGMKIRILPSGNDFGRLIPVRSGNAHFSVMSGVSAYAGAHGLWDYAKYEWGPQPLRQILGVIDEEQGISVAVAADANIKTLKDLKGKRVTYVPGGTSINVCMEATLAFAGLTWNDVVRIPAPSLGTSMKFLGEGKADAAWASTTSPAMFEVERSPHGVYWPEYPTEDKGGWERMLKVAPFVIPVAAIKGVGVSKEKPRKLISYAYPFIQTYEQVSEDLVYEMTKAIDVSFELYQNCHAVMPFWNLKKATNLTAMSLPYHAGAIKYLKEKGLWDKELEKRQIALQKEQVSLKKIWDEALSEATAKKIKEEALGDFWIQKRAEALK